MEIGTKQERISFWKCERTVLMFQMYLRRHHSLATKDIENRFRDIYYSVKYFSIHCAYSKILNANNKFCCLHRNIYLSEVSTFSYLGINICKHILKFSNCVLVRVAINNNNYEQPIALFVIILSKNTFTNHHGVI